MPACTFFGHRECPDSMKDALAKAIEDLISHHGVTIFYVGNQGRFDTLARSALRDSVKKHPFVRYAVVLAYLPNVGAGDTEDDTMLPEGLETVPPRFAISRRNDWMLRHADYVIAYVTHSWGGAAQYVQKAVQKNKNVIFLQP